MRYNYTLALPLAAVLMSAASGLAMASTSPVNPATNTVATVAADAGGHQLQLASRDNDNDRDRGNRGDRGDRGDRPDHSHR